MQVRKPVLAVAVGLNATICAITFLTVLDPIAAPVVTAGVALTTTGAGLVGWAASFRDAALRRLSGLSRAQERGGTGGGAALPAFTASARLIRHQHRLGAFLTACGIVLLLATPRLNLEVEDNRLRLVAGLAALSAVATAGILTFTYSLTPKEVGT